MAAPIGNQFWKLASKHGREKLFSTPEAMWEAAIEYFEATDARKWGMQDWVGKNGDEVIREADIPYTMSGLCIFLGVSRFYFIQFKAALKPNESDTDKEFSHIIARIEDIIYTQKFEGATVGAFNANIIARDLGLTDKQEQKIDQTITGKVGVTVVSSGIPLSNKESDVNPSRS